MYHYLQRMLNRTTSLVFTEFFFTLQQVSFIAVLVVIAYSQSTLPLLKSQMTLFRGGCDVFPVELDSGTWVSLARKGK